MFWREKTEKPSELKIVCPGVFKSLLSNTAATSRMWPFKLKEEMGKGDSRLQKYTQAFIFPELNISSIKIRNIQAL